MKQRIVLGCILALTCTVISAQSSMKSIFNGKNLKKWTVPENNIYWTAQDGILSVRNGPNKKGSILWTKKKYQNFEMELDFKMGDGTVDSGVFIREEKLQIQIGESGSLKRDMTASPYIPGMSYPVEAADIPKLLNPKGWNTMKIKAVDKLTQVWLNGQEVMNYTYEEGISKGPIGLQLHGNRDMNVDFKNLRVRKIK